MPHIFTKSDAKRASIKAAERRTEQSALTPLERLERAGAPTQYGEEMRATYVYGYIKAHTTASKAAAIKAKCLECCCWDRVAASACDIDACPLYNHNPWRKKRAARDDRESLP